MADKRIPALLVVAWVSQEEAEERGLTSWQWMLGGGWFEEGMRWSDYREGVATMAGPEAVSHLEALREVVVGQLVRFSGLVHQHQAGGVPVFDDGTCFSVGWRAWADFMAAVWSTEEGVDYSYIDFHLWNEPPPFQSRGLPIEVDKVDPKQRKRMKEWGEEV